MSIWTRPLNNDMIGQCAQLGGAARSLGIEIVEIGEDFLSGKLPVDDRTTQPFGLLNGGASCLLAETIGSIAANSCVKDLNTTAVGMYLNASHLRPATSGWVTGTARPKHIGSKTQVWDINIVNDQDKSICLVTFGVSVIPRP